MIDKQDERIQSKCDNDRIDQFREDDLIQVQQEIEITPQQIGEEINNDHI